MLKSIRLKNIKGHKDSTLILSPGLNIITGDTDSGKSTFSRAFNWLTTNQRGYNPRPWKHLKPSGESAIIVETAEGDIVERVKHTGINGYRLNGEVFKALGSDVPEEVQNALRMGTVNLQAQKDSYYLLGDTAGSVAKEFNRIADLSDMDRMISSIQSLKVKTADDVSHFTDIIQVREESLKKLEFVTYADQELTQLEDRDEDLELLKIEVGNVAGLIGYAARAQRELDHVSPGEMFEDFKKLQGREVDRSQFNSISQAVARFKDLKQYADRFVNLYLMVDEAEELDAKSLEVLKAKEEISFISQGLQRVKAITIAPADLFSDFEEIQSRDTSGDRLDIVEKTVKNLKWANRVIRDSALDIATSQEKLNKLIPTSGICQLCKRSL
jgi:energy-coupling factor transporter ATP-binding protein EcfA2